MLRLRVPNGVGQGASSDPSRPSRVIWTARAASLTVVSSWQLPDTGAVYLVPITDVPDRGACLRVKPTKNNQVKGVRWAKDYVLGGKVEVAAVAG